MESQQLGKGSSVVGNSERAAVTGDGNWLTKAENLNRDVMADTSRSDSELEKELLYTPEIGKKVR